MEITKETVIALAAEGITIKPYPCTDEERATQVKKEFDRWYGLDYWRQFRSELCKDGSTPEEAYTAALGREIARKTAAYGSWNTGWDQADKVYIRKGDMLFVRNAPSGKKATADWVRGVVKRDSKAYAGAYGDFAKRVNDLCRERLQGCSGYVYPTTYGIGVWVFYNYRLDECLRNVEEVLHGLGVEYRNEYSDAHWVFRYVISKKSANRNRLGA